MKHFVDNIKRVKKVATNQSKKKATEDKKDLLEVEEVISRLFDNNVNAFFTEKDLQSLKILEGRKKALLEKETVQ